jgi:zinc/manganese transport system substrate-binding protein
MKAWTKWALAIALLVGGSVSAKVNVVATTGDLGALVREVGGKQVSVTVLARHTQDPHFVDARPTLVLDASRARLLVVNGLELETGWLPPVLTASRNPAIQPGQPGHLDASTVIEPRDVPHGKVDRSMGDIHPGGNPHYTKDPRNGLRVARAIAERLGQIDPERKQEYLANLAKLEEELGAKIAQWETTMAPFKGTRVVTYHKSWIYFVSWAGLQEVAFVEPKPGLPPSAGHVSRVLSVIREQQVPLILQEEWYPAATSELLARNSGARLARIPGQAAETQTYAQHIGVMVEAVVTALRAARQ